MRAIGIVVKRRVAFDVPGGLDYCATKIWKKNLNRFVGYGV